MSQCVKNVDKSVSRKVTAKQALEIISNLDVCTVCNQTNRDGTNCEKENCPW